MTTLDVGQTQAELYSETAATFHAALERLARAYEADPESRRDMLQEIHLALWRSFEISTDAVPYGPGSIASPITPPPRMSAANVKTTFRLSLSKRRKPPPI